MVPSFCAALSRSLSDVVPTATMRAPASLDRIQCFSGFRRNMADLRMHPVVLRVVCLYRQESARPDM